MPTATKPQHSVIAEIMDGSPVTQRQEQENALAPDHFPRQIVAAQWSRDGMDVLAHRTVLCPDPDQRTGNPRLDYRVEMFRISPTGTVTRL